MEIRLFDLKLIAHDRLEEMKLIKDIEDITLFEDLEFGGFIIIDGKSYHHCAYHKEKDILVVEPMDLNEHGEKVEYSDDFVCPYCGNINQDAFELSDDGETECSSCGSKLEYERIVTVGYTIIPKKCAPITRV